MQLELFRNSEDHLREVLEARSGMRLNLRITDNASSLVAFHANAQRTRATLRLHHMFLGAGPDVLHALATWLTHRRHKRSAAVVDAFIQSHSHLIRRGKTHRRLRTRGRFHDLAAYYQELNATEFENRVDAPITWGRRSTRPRRRSIRLGSYSPEEHLIRIHPNLDQGFVPDYFVRYIVFHEMLHADLGIEFAPSGRRRIHTPEFNQRERSYREYDRAIAWHEARGNLDRLMRAPRAS